MDRKRHHIHHRAHHHLHEDTTELTNNSVKFSADEFRHSAKNELWYAGVGLLILALLFVGWQNKDYLFMAVVVALGIAIFRMIQFKPENKDITISKKGVYWGKEFFGYHQFRSFWITKSGNDVSLYLDRINYKPVVHIVLPDNKVEAVAEVLEDKLPWHESKTEPISDRFARMLGI